MKKIGLVGGTGPESTLMYYKELNTGIDEVEKNTGVSLVSIPQAVVLGCTEIPLLLNDENCVLPCLDSVAIHIERLKELVLNDVL